MSTDDQTIQNNNIATTTVSLGGESGPITIENGQNLSNEAVTPLESVEVEKTLEQKKETLTNNEVIQPVDTIETNVVPVTATTPAVTNTILEEKTEDIKREITPPKTIGIPVRKDLYEEKPEDISEKAGKGPIDSAFTALMCFVDKLLKKQGQKQ